MRLYFISQLYKSHLFASTRKLGFKVIIEKSRGEVSLVEQDTIENVSKPTRNQKKISFLDFL